MLEELNIFTVVYCFEILLLLFTVLYCCLLFFSIKNRPYSFMTDKLNYLTLMRTHISDNTFFKVSLCLNTSFLGLETSKI